VIKNHRGEESFLENETQLSIFHLNRAWTRWKSDNYLGRISEDKNKIATSDNNE
jgi:hypothetical protein